jgi:transposase-like protein
MNQFTTDFAQALVQKEDVTKIFRSHLENAVNTLLASELTAFLDYEKYDRIGFNTGNSRNGSYERTLHTEFGGFWCKDCICLKEVYSVLLVFNLMKLFQIVGE